MVCVHGHFFGSQIGIVDTFKLLICDVLWRYSSVVELAAEKTSCHVSFWNDNAMTSAGCLLFLYLPIAASRVLQLRGPSRSSRFMLVQHSRWPGRRAMNP